MRNLRGKIGWILAGVLGLYIVATAAGAVSGGPLDPSGSPAPTGKTLDEIPGSWSRKLPANDAPADPGVPANCNSTRFQCVLDDAGVLDRESGLVWTRFSGTNMVNWIVASLNCQGNVNGERAGWRLPSIEEMQTLLDYSLAATPPLLPTGHPFASFDPDDGYWTGTPDGPGTAKVLWLDGSGGSADKIANQYFYWCVRGGQGPQQD